VFIDPSEMAEQADIREVRGDGGIAIGNLC